jgi:uncharacterized protein (TIGR03067 family)
MSRFGLLALVLCGCSGQPAPSDAQRIIGEWVVVDAHSPNEKEDRSQRRKHAIVTEWTWSQQFQGEQFEDFEYTLNPSKSPKEIDLTFTDASGKRLTVRGIYELSLPDAMGDRLRVCLGSPPVVQKNGKTEYPESVRPVSFEAKDATVFIYRRKTE